LIINDLDSNTLETTGNKPATVFTTFTLLNICLNNNYTNRCTTRFNLALTIAAYVIQVFFIYSSSQLFNSTAG
jgi:hypothetical protein